MTLQRAPIRKIGTDRLMVMGVPRKWFTPYVFFSLEFLVAADEKLSGTIGAALIFLMCHAVARVVVGVDPYALEITLRVMKHRRVIPV